MKYLLIFFTKFTCIVAIKINDFNFFPNLPAGEFKMVFKSVSHCTPQTNEGLYFNYYFYKVSADTVEQRGNMTYTIPFDDSLIFNVNMAIKDSIGGWKENAMVYTTQRACSSLKNLMGKEWIPYLQIHNINKTNCPIPPGVYVSKGYDVYKVIGRANFPKQFFYGTYRSIISFLDKNKKIVGCYGYIIDIIRPWETV